MPAEPTKEASRAAADPVARIDLLEGIRGLLACWVMIGHFVLYLGAADLVHAGTTSWLSRICFIVVNGDMPVCLFMVISGFVISHLIIMRQEPYGVYIARRFMRLFPALACCFILGVLVSHWQSDFLPTLPWAKDFWITNIAEKATIHRQYLWQNITAHAFMVHGILPPSLWPDLVGAFLGPAWSISTEWQFYLIAPLLLAASRKLPGLLLVCAGVLLSSIVFSKLRLGVAVDNYNGAFLGFYIQYFFLGGLSYALWQLLRRAFPAFAASGRFPGMAVSSVGLSGLLLLPVVFGLMQGASVTPFLPVAVFAIWIVMFACMCQITAAPQSAEARFVEGIGCSRPILFLGRISYSIYLVHFPLGVVLLKLGQPLLGLPRPAFIAFYLIVGSLMTIGCAALLYRYVESPAIDWAKRTFRPSRKPA